MKLEEYEIIPYNLAKKKGVVNSISQFRRIYAGFFNGRDHMLSSIMRSEMEPGATHEEAVEYIDDEYTLIEDADMIHVFEKYDMGEEIYKYYTSSDYDLSYGTYHGDEDY